MKRGRCRYNAPRLHHHLEPTPLLYETLRSRARSGVRRLAAHTIPVVLLPPAADFLSAPVHREWIAHAKLAAAFTQRYQLSNVRGLIRDAEAPLHASLDLVGSHAAEVSEATQNLHDLLTTLHHDCPNLQIGITAQWPQYLDGFDHDADLATVMRSPVDPAGGTLFFNGVRFWCATRGKTAHRRLARTLLPQAKKRGVVLRKSATT